MRHRATLAAMGMTTLVACDARAGHDARAARPAAVGARATADVGAARWTRTFAGVDALVDPTALAATRGQLIIADAGAHRVLALDDRTGAERWRTGAGAPRDVAGGLVAPLAIAVTPSGAIAVADAAARRIHLLSPDGAPVAVVALGGDVAPRRLCATADGGFVVAGADARGRLLEVDAQGVRGALVGWPWPDADSLDDLRLQAVLASTPDGTRCAAALRLGRGLAVLAPGAPPVFVPAAYVEALPLPGLRVTESGPPERRTRHLSIGDAPLAARDVAATSTTVAVAFQGLTGDRARLVDLHALDDGAYRATLRLPVQAHAIAARDSTLFVLHRAGGQWAVSAFAAPPLHGPARGG